jgi:hypothetical protein
MATFTATYQGKTFTRNSRTVKYTHVTLITHPVTGELVDARWSKSLAGAKAKLPHGWEALRVAIVTVLPEGVFVKNDKVYGPVKALRPMVEAGQARFTKDGDLVLI